MRSLSVVALLGAALAATTAADEPVDTARPVPLTRPAMKHLLEDMKNRAPRFPLPELSDADRARLGDRADSYEARLRHHYLAKDETSVIGGGARPAAGAAAPVRDFTRNADEHMSLSYPFKTRLFWIVSRTNNCQYCLGHQEQKLSAAGMTDDEIAALDADWGRHPPAERAAFAYARKLTYEPHRLTDADVAELERFYTKPQILEMTLSVAGNNAINRWKEGTGVPQSRTGEHFFRRAENLPADRPVPNESFLTPTSPQFREAVSVVAPARIDAAAGRTFAFGNRPPLEPRKEVEAALVAVRTRVPRLPVATEADARAALGDDAPAGPLPAWVRLMATFPNEARGRLRALGAVDDPSGDLSPLLKAQVAWIVARQDRAWYATGLMRQRLRDLGQTDEQIFALDGTWKEFDPAERSLFRFARRLAAAPIALTDADAAEALELAGPRQVVQLIDYITGRAYFDRVTEAAGLPLEPSEGLTADGRTDLR